MNVYSIHSFDYLLRQREREQQLQEYERLNAVVSAKCSKCSAPVIEDGCDVGLWRAEDYQLDNGTWERTYTCAFCDLGVEPGSLEAKVILGPYYNVGKQESYEDAIKQQQDRLLELKGKFALITRPGSVRTKRRE